MRPSTVIRRAIAGMLLAGCAQAYHQPALHERDQVPARDSVGKGVLKVHMRSGELYLLDRWEVADSGRSIRGTGTRFDALRVAQPGDSASIPTEGVALLETNSQGYAYALGLQGIGVMTTLGAYVSLVCLLDPKSCFGSCPTFYVEGEDTSRVHAEGFSSSVARVLEARDVDALGELSVAGRRIAIRMRNEAWETHMVRRVSLLAVPKPPGGRVFAAGDSLFYPATELTPPSRCAAPDGDCVRAFSAHDGVERLSKADSNDLAARETIDLTFAALPQRPGIVVTARNSLVSTFLFYQTLAYLGTRAGDALASMERGTRASAEAQFGMAHLLGGIEVQLRDSAGDWRTVGTYQEAGPIASDTKVIRLPDGLARGPLTIRLRAAKGNWRIDRVALAALGDPVQPTRIEPATVQRDGRDDTSALRSLKDSSEHLVTMPGDEYRLVFDLPSDALELFLESEGFYYEWQRKEWLAEENPLMAATVILNPAEGLRLLAAPYKVREGKMEQLFWASRFNVRSRDAQNR